MEGALRILHVVHSMNHGEIETALMDVYRNLDRSKIQFDFLTNREGDYDEEVRRLGGFIYRISNKGDVGVKGYRRALRQFFKDHRYYIIIHTHLDQMSTYALWAAKRVGIPVRVAHSHNTGSEGTFKSKVLANLVGSLVPYYATDYFACTADAAKWLFKKRADQVEIMRNPIELERFCYSQSTRDLVRKELNISDKDFVIGHIGSFIWQKNHDYLIELFVGFRRKIPQSKLILIGEGPLRENIEKKINQYHIADHVILLGAKDNTEHWIQAFDLIVSPSFHEGLPLPLIEAQSSGLPILASDRITKEIDLGNGLIQFLPIDVKKDWLDAMYQAYNNKYRKPVNSDVLIEKGYDVKQVAKKTERKYLQLRDDGI